MLTTKKLHLKSIIHELLWFLKGDTNIAVSEGKRRSISGTNGPMPTVTSGRSTAISGASWPTHDGRHLDQIVDLIEGLKKNPNSRRHIVSAWNPALIAEMALPPCHCLFQFYVSDGKLSCQLYQRSGDVFLGVPFNIASYALLTLMVAQVSRSSARRFRAYVRAIRISITTISTRCASNWRAQPKGPCRRWSSIRM